MSGEGKMRDALRTPTELGLSLARQPCRTCRTRLLPSSPCSRCLTHFRTSCRFVSRILARRRSQPIFAWHPRKSQSRSLSQHRTTPTLQHHPSEILIRRPSGGGPSKARALPCPKATRAWYCRATLPSLHTQRAAQRLRKSRQPRPLVVRVAGRALQLCRTRMSQLRPKWTSTLRLTRIYWQKTHRPRVLSFQLGNSIPCLSGVPTLPSTRCQTNIFVHSTIGPDSQQRSTSHCPYPNLDPFQSAVCIV